MSTAALQPPKPPLISPLEPFEEMPDEPQFEGLHILNQVDWPDYGNDPWQIDACKLEKCLISAVSLQRLKLWDSILVRTDLSGIRCFEAGLLRSEFLGCRLSGMQFGEGTIRDVVFQNCKLNLLSFKKCRLERVVFRDCVLTEAEFNGAHLTDVVFTNCELGAANFSGTKNVRVDMTRNDVTEIKGVTSLKGVRITAEQMTQLAPLLCAEVGFILAD